VDQSVDHTARIRPETPPEQLARTRDHARAHPIELDVSREREQIALIFGTPVASLRGASRCT